jgi:hypothetical protein
MASIHEILSGVSRELAYTDDDEEERAFVRMQVDTLLLNLDHELDREVERWIITHTLSSEVTERKGRESALRAKAVEELGREPSLQRWLDNLKLPTLETLRREYRYPDQRHHLLKPLLLRMVEACLRVVGLRALQNPAVFWVMRDTHLTLLDPSLREAEWLRIHDQLAALLKLTIPGSRDSVIGPSLYALAREVNALRNAIGRVQRETRRVGVESDSLVLQRFRKAIPDVSQKAWDALGSVPRKDAYGTAVQLVIHKYRLKLSGETLRQYLKASVLRAHSM